MRAFNHLLLAATLAISIVSCQKEPSFHHDAIPSPSDLVASLAPETYGIDGDNTFVPAMAVEGYAMSKKPAITKAGGSISVEPVLNEANDTVFYIVNYGDNDGWELISADARTPRILAEGYSGSFTYPTEIEPLNVWIEGMIADLTAVREAEDSELTFSSEQISANISAWTGTASPHVIQPGGELDGTYVGTSTYETQPYDSIPHMMVTQWHQHEPYNSYVPLKSTGSDRSPAGCVAVAAAQVLYYLHGTINKPYSMESQAYCYLRNTDPNYLTFMNQSANSVTVWNDMVPSYRLGSVSYCAEAVMIAKVGKLLEMEYYDNESLVYTSKLKNRVFDYYNIGCESRTFTIDRLREGLLNSTPVIIGADNAYNPNGHTFVIDGYKRFRNKVTTHFTWVPSDPHSFDDPANHPDFETISYTNPVIEFVKMNWGDENQWRYGYGNGWFLPTTGWVYPGNYFTAARILYNFHN